MAAYAIRRLATGALSLLGVSFLAFLVVALAPGNPASLLLGQFASPEQVAALTEQLGLDEPFWLRYLYWLREAVQGDLGVSSLNRQPVVSLLADAIPVTLQLALTAIVLAIVFALPVGMWIGLHHHASWSRLAMFLVVAGTSIPGFWVGLILIIVFAVNLGWLPPGGYVRFSDDPIANLESLLLPALTLSIWLAPNLTRFVRAATVATLQEDYIRAAIAKGITERRLLFGHIAKNVGIPTITFIGLQLGALISGAVIVEVVFALPGIGRLGISSVLARDYPIIQGVVLFVAAGYILVNLAIDLAYGLLDPRARTP